MEESKKKISANEEKKSGCSSFCSFIKTASVEPAGFLLVISMVVSALVFQNLLMETICRVDLGYEADTCEEIIQKVNITYKKEEREIQKVAADLSAITSVTLSSITILVVLFIGPWSDANGRKIPLLISIAGLVIYPAMMIVCYLNLGKMKALPLVLLASVPMEFTGSVAVFAMSAYSYVSDTTEAKDRTVRTGLLSACVRSGTPFGFAIGGALLKFNVGKIQSLLFAVVLSFTSFLIVLFKVKNVVPKEKAKKEIEDDGTPIKKKKKKSKWVRYNPLTKLVQAFAIMFKKRKDRGTFYLLILCQVCYAAPGSGEYSMSYLFVRERLQWNISDYGFFSMYNWLMSAAGVFLSMFILSKKLKIADPIVGFISGLSQIGGSIFYAFVSSAAMMYCASGLDMMNGTIGVVARSMLSKIVAPDEVGKLFALLGVIESILPLASVPTYAMVYKNTVTVFAGCFYFLSAAITLPAEIIFLYFMLSKKKRNFEHTSEPVENPAEKCKSSSKSQPHVIDEVEIEFEALNKAGPEGLRLMPHELMDNIEDSDEEEDELVK